MEGWKGGRMEEWKVEGWKGGRMEEWEWKSGRVEGLTFTDNESISFKRCFMFSISKSFPTIGL